MGGAVAAVAEALKDRVQVGEEVNIDGGIAAQVLAQRKLAGLAAEVACPQQLERLPLPVVNVRAGRNAFDGVDDEVGMTEAEGRRGAKVGGKAVDGLSQHRRQLVAGDGPPVKATAGTAPFDDGGEGIAAFKLGRGQRDKTAGRFRQGEGGRLTAPVRDPIGLG